MSYFKGIGRKSGSYTGRKLPLVGLLENKKHTIFNEYVPGSSVGASSVVTRRLKKQRARIKKCTPPEPILPEFGDDDVFVIDDDISTFNSILEEQIKTLPLGTTINLGDISDNNVDEIFFTTYAKFHLDELKNTNINSFTFATISEENIADSAVNTTDGVNSINALLSSTEKYNVITYEPIINTISNNGDANISLYTTHTFINTGPSSTGGIPNIEYVMTITEFIPLQ